MLIPKSVFNVSSCSGEDCAKFPFDGIKLERDGDNVYAVASDGWRIIIAKWDDSDISQDYKDVSGSTKTGKVENFSTLVPVKFWDEAGKAIPKIKKNEPAILEHSLLIEEEATKTIPIESCDAEGNIRRLAPKPIQGNFPEWKKEFPKYEVIDSDPSSNKAVRIRLNAKLLAELIKSIGQTVGKSDDTIDMIVPFNSLRPVEIRSNKNEGVLVSGLLNPINASDKVPFINVIGGK